MSANNGWNSNENAEGQGKTAIVCKKKKIIIITKKEDIGKISTELG